MNRKTAKSTDKGGNTDDKSLREVLDGIRDILSEPSAEEVDDVVDKKRERVKNPETQKLLDRMRTLAKSVSESPDFRSPLLREIDSEISLFADKRGLNKVEKENLQRKFNSRESLEALGGALGDIPETPEYEYERREIIRPLVEKVYGAMKVQ